MDIGEFNGCRLYTGMIALRLNYRLRLWAAASPSHAVSAVAELVNKDTTTDEERVLQ